MHVQIASRVAGVTRLTRIGALAGEMADISEPLRDVLGTILRILGADGGAVLLRDPVTGAQNEVLSIGLSADSNRDGHAQARRGLEQADRTELPMVTLGGDAMGVVRVYFGQAQQLRERQVDLAAGFVRQAAEMVERARLYGEARGLAVLQQRRIAQVRQLAEAATAMSAAQNVPEILRLATEEACAIIGTHQGVTSRLLHGWTEATTHVVLSDKYAQWRTYDRVPQGLGVLDYVTRENKPLRLTGEQLVRHPEWRGLRDAPDHPPLPDYLAAPLVGRDGHNLGLIQLSDKIDGTDFSEEDEAMLVQLAQLASAGIENCELLQLERRSREQAERSERGQRLLSQASHAFAMSLDLEQTISTVTRILVPEFADWCGVHLLGPDGRLRLEGSAAQQDGIDEAIRKLAGRRRQKLDVPAGAGAVVRTGVSELYPEVPDEVLRAVATPEVPYEDLKSLGISSALVAPLPGRGSTIGALTLIRLAGEPYSTSELQFAEELARRAALSVENATRFELERKAADMLQHTMLPSALPRSERLWCAGRYRAGVAGTRVGGDWYDVIELDERSVLLVVGDVMGHGVKAAVTMGQLRSAVLAFASEGHPPGALLERLDALVRRLCDAQFATCLCVLLDTHSGAMTLATAGHPPPLLVTAEGESHYLEVEPGLPLGLDVGRWDFTEHGAHLPPHATLLLYTDGLVESRQEPLESGMRRVRTAAARCWDSPEELCEHLLRNVGIDDRLDDLAILAVQRASRAMPTAGSGDGDGSGASEGSVSLLLDRRSPGRARAFVRDQLRRWGYDGVEDTAVLLTSELVTNAQLHGREPLELRVLHGGDRVRVEVSDGSSELPTARDYGLEAGTGRGLRIVEQLSAAWGVDGSAAGKTVWFEVRS